MDSFAEKEIADIREKVETARCYCVSALIL